MTEDGAIIRIRDREDLTGKADKADYEVRVFVGHAMYIWKNTKFTAVKGNGAAMYRMTVSGSPKVLNRRKYPRLPLTNNCDIFVKSKNSSFSGKMVNISAGGYALETSANEFANAVGEKIQITVKDFEILSGTPLYGTVIRSTDNRGSYIVGCRMLEDNTEIMNYVKARMPE